MLGGAAKADRLQVDQTSTDGPALFGVDVSSRMTLPLGSGALVGALAVGHATSRPRGFTMLCQRIGRAIVESADVLLAQAVAHEELDARVNHFARASQTDALTGVANRRGWDDALAALSAHGAPRSSVLISCDVDGMKDVNDRHGHAAGDAVLVATARLLQRYVRADDVVARVGGDEFAVLVGGGDLGTARAIVQRIRRAERSEKVYGYRLTPRLSMGVAEISRGHQAQAQALADERMYANKRRRKAAMKRVAQAN
jgi:diguanylate cyclase (GGDEF)-like protein